MNLLPLSAAADIKHFSVEVKADCLGCTLAEQFPSLRQQLQGHESWTPSIRRVGSREVAGLTVIASSGDTETPDGLKPLERQAWVSMAERGQMRLFLPQKYNDTTVVEQGEIRVEVQPIGAHSVKAERQGKTLVYKNTYPSTDSIQVAQAGRSEEFLYLHDRSAPKIFDYQIRVGKGVHLSSVGGSVAFLDGQGRGVRIEKPWLVDSEGLRSESAVHWQILEEGKRLRLVVEPQGLRYPLVVDPSWSNTGSMSTPRYAHTATLLSSGKVLVVGGRNDSSTALKSAELYDPQTRSWSSTGSMSTARQVHTATLLSNGKVLVAGGSTVGSTSGSAELYNPQTGTWSNTGSLSDPRFGHTATLLSNGKVLVVGGQGSINSISNLVGIAELYDPQTGIWSNTGSISTPRYLHTATLLPNGTVLVAGGLGFSFSLFTLSSVELYDPQAGAWSTTASMNTAREAHTATLLPNGQVLVAGGTSSFATEIYDPQTGIWSNTGSISTPRLFHTATLLPNGQALITGGGNAFTLSEAELYESQAGAWTITASMNAARSSHTATLLPNGQVLVTGGGGPIGTLNSAELYGNAPVVTSFSPTSASVGSIVTLTGSGFTGVTSVTVNGQTASFGFISDSQLNLQVPAGATSGPITVTTPAGSATSTTSLIVLGNPPVITSFSPASGPVGTTVTINGANFTGATSVRFRTKAASFTVLSDSQIQTVVPAGANSGAIVVITPNGFNTSPTKFTVTP